MGRPVIDLINQRFGRLTVLERDTTKPSGAGKSAYWICKCDCGNIKSIRSDKLQNHITQSCGCLSKEIHSKIFLKDLTGQRFGKLVVLERDITKPMGKECFAYWICKCDCGNTTSVRSDHLRNGDIVGCGCANSKGEIKIRQILDQYHIPYKTQVIFPDLLGDQDNLRFDFGLYNNENKLLCLIEYQGEQHFKPYSWDTEGSFNLRQCYDNKKKEYCKNNNIPLYEIIYSDYNKITFDWLKTFILELGEYR